MSGAIVKLPPGELSFSEEQIDTLRRTICAKASDAELELFLTLARRAKLDPFGRQIYMIPIWDKALGRERMSPVTSIDGFRLIAERTGQYTGQQGPFWCGPDGEWRDVWLSDEPPAAAKVIVLRANFTEPLTGTAVFRSYARRGRDGSPIANWASMPDVMLAKCAEALALRRAFPHDLSGLYTADEMDHLRDAPGAVTVSVPPPRAAAKKRPAKRTNGAALPAPKAPADYVAEISEAADEKALGQIGERVQAAISRGELSHSDAQGPIRTAYAARRDELRAAGGDE